MDSHLSYQRVVHAGRAQQRGRGFKLNHRRFSVYRLKARFLYLIKSLSRWNWKSSCGQAVGSIKNSIITRGRSNCKRIDSRRGLATDHQRSNFDSGTGYRLRQYGRSNSFYSEAIADCLEFIKRTSVSTDDDESVAKRDEE